MFLFLLHIGEKFSKGEGDDFFLGVGDFCLGVGCLGVGCLGVGDFCLGVGDSLELKRKDVAGTMIKQHVPEVEEDEEV